MGCHGGYELWAGVRCVAPSGNMCRARATPSAQPRVPLPAALPCCFHAGFLSCWDNPATNKRKSPTRRRNSPRDMRGEAGATVLGKGCAASGQGWTRSPAQGGCPCRPPPRPSHPTIRCCRKSPCTRTVCLKPLCPDNAEESQRFGACGGPRPLGLGRLQWGEQQGRRCGHPRPGAWTPSRTCWGGGGSLPCPSSMGTGDTQTPSQSRRREPREGDWWGPLPC